MEQALQAKMVDIAEKIPDKGAKKRYRELADM